MNKKIFSVGALLLLALSLAGCSRDRLITNDGEFEQQEVNTEKVALADIPLPPQVPILMYHHIGDVPVDQTTNAIRQDLTVSAADFEAQLKWLKENNFYPSSFGELQVYLAAHGKVQPLSNFAMLEKPVILSFDDGYSDMYTVAFPLLQKYGMRGSFGIITGSVGNPEYLTWEQIQAMQKGGMEFLSHTVSHPDLRTISAAALKKELTDSKLTLEIKLGGEISTLIYPSGKYDQKVLDATAAAGYKLARTTNPGVTTKNSKPLELATIRIHKTTSLKSLETNLK